MSMALALQYGTEWLRTKYGFTATQCGVQFDALPPNDAGQFYIALDDGGIETGPDNTAALTETLNITVGIWRKPEHLALKDKRGNLQLPIDKYLIGAYTLHDLERKVIVERPSEKMYGLHQSWSFMRGLNERYALPHLVDGDVFFTPLFYRGRGRMETVGIERGILPDGSVDAQTWYGYRLRFRGLSRTQATNNPFKYFG
jgi:hypothetical protein